MIQVVHLGYIPPLDILFDPQQVEVPRRLPLQQQISSHQRHHQSTVRRGCVPRQSHPRYLAFDTSSFSDIDRILPQD
jgi:hypothetical protein